MLKSLLLGTEGNYNIFGIEVEFVKKDNQKIAENNSNIKKIFNACLNSKVFEVCTILLQSHSHVFVHTMSHALTAKWITDQKVTAIIITNGLLVGIAKKTSPTSIVNESLIEAAGLIEAVAFSTVKLVALCALKNYISWPLTLVFAVPPILFITLDISNNIYNVLYQENCCLGRTAQRKPSHLLPIGAVLAAQVAFATFVTVKLFS